MAWHIYHRDTKLQTGDIIESSAAQWFLVHFGILFYKDGVLYIAHCPLMDEGRPVMEPFEQFKKKRIIYRYFRDGITQELSDEYIAQRAEFLQRYPYDATTFNCEDFVKSIAEGVKLGIDLRLGIGLTVVVVIIVVVIVVKLIRR